MGTYWILVSLILFVCILLILVVMVQNPKGGGLSSSFGGGQSQIGGVKSTTDFLDKSTWVLAAIILILILISNVTLMNDSENTDSILIDESMNCIICIVLIRRIIQIRENSTLIYYLSFKTLRFTSIMVRCFARL